MEVSYSIFINNEREKDIILEKFAALHKNKLHQSLKTAIQMPIVKGAGSCVIISILIAAQLQAMVKRSCRSN